MDCSVRVGGSVQSQNGGPCRSSFLCDGWVWLVGLWPCWLHACFMGWCCDPLIRSERSPLQLLIQLNSLTQNSSSKNWKKKSLKAILSHLFVLIYLLSCPWKGEKEALGSAAVPCRGAHLHTTRAVGKLGKMRMRSDVSLSQHYWKQRCLEWIHSPSLGLCFHPVWRRRETSNVFVFFLWLEAVFWAGDGAFVALRHRKAANRAQDKSSVG